MKLVTIVGTRPEIIRLSETIKCADRHFDHVLVHTGQNWDYTLNQIFFEDLGLREPDFYLDAVGDDLGQTMGNIIAKSYKVLREASPDAVLILGDTNSALSAISAKRLKIPIFHMEAGNRCWDWNVPEMINRTIVDHISDINLSYTEHARRYLLAEGIDGKTIFVTGSPMREVLEGMQGKIASSDILDRLSVKRGGYIVLSAHREENIDDDVRIHRLMDAVNHVAENTGLPVIYSTHPRSRKRLEEAGIALHPLVRCEQPFGFTDYVRLQQDSHCVLSDSGTLSEESAILGFPAVLIRTSTERPEVLDSGNIVIGGIGAGEMLDALRLAVALSDTDVSLPPPTDYAASRVSEKVVRIIQGYARIVDETTWRKC